MKKCITWANKAHLVRGVFYLLPLVAVYVIPFALGQRYVAGSIGAENGGDAESTPQLLTTSSGDHTVGPVQVPQFPAGVLYDQYNNPAMEPPLGIGSQQFEPAMAAFDDQVADDFVLPPLPPNNFYYSTGVSVMGEYSAGGGPATSFNVYFYSNGAGNLPGALIGSFLNLPYTGIPPDFTINFLVPLSLAPGTYWVSVQAVQDFNPNGQWFWHNRTVQSNAGAAWQNPGDGYGTGCTNWNLKNICIPKQVWPDQVFQIRGFPEGPTPTATATATTTATPMPSSTPTATIAPSPTPTVSATPTATGMPRVTPTPRPRPSAARRP